MSKKYLRLLLIIAILSLILAFFSLILTAGAAASCKTNADCLNNLSLPGILANDPDSFKSGGIQPGMPGICTEGYNYICTKGYCEFDNSTWLSGAMFHKDECLSPVYLKEYQINKASPHECNTYVDFPYVGCSGWCASMYEDINGYATGDCETASCWGYGSESCGYCACRDVYGNPIPIGTPSLKIIQPAKDMEINNTCKVNVSMWLPIKVNAIEDVSLNWIDVIIATPIPGVHCSYWPSQLIKFDPVRDIHTFDCIRDALSLDCLNIPLRNWDMKQRNPDVCPIVALKSPCAVMSITEDVYVNSYNTKWTYFYINSCGDGVCDPFENPSICSPDCKYSFMEQLSRIFDMVKIKIRVWR